MSGQWGLRVRPKLIISLILACSIGLFVHAMLYLYDSFIDGRKLAVRNVVEVAHRILETHHQLELNRKLSRAEAQQASLDSIRSLRYGGEEYFWINDMHPRMVMHPTRPELDGQELGNFSDPRGKKLFVDFVDIVRREGGGFVDYQWPKPGQMAPVNKISYVTGFAPWGWIIGSGVYLDDIENEFRREFMQNAGLLIVFSMLMVLLARRLSFNLQVEKTLRESEARLRRVVEKLPVAAVIAAGNKTYLINRKFTQILGYEAADLSSLEDWWPVAFPDPAYREEATRNWWQQVAATLADDTAGNVVAEYRIRAKDGSERVMEVSYCQSDEWAVISFYDLTERKAAEAHQRLTARVFDTTGEAILVTDTEARIIAVNPAFCRITGYSREEVLGKNPNLLNSGRHDAQFHQAMWRSLLETGEWVGEVWNRRKNGEVFPEWQTVSSVRDADGKVTNYVAVFADVSEIRNAQEKAEHLSWRDSLTGLANRALFLQRLEQCLGRVEQSAGRAAVVLVDLDRFKDINEARGFGLGDSLLKVIAERFAQVLKAEDVLARLSSDEFAVLLSRPTTGAEAAARTALAVAEKLRAVLRDDLFVDGESFHLAASIGITVFPQRAGEAAADVMRQADMAMHRAKSEGGERAVFFEDAMGESAMERYRLERELRQAVAAGELRLFLQPQVNAEGRAVGAEALVRWQNPQRGLVPPGLFIPLAEASDLIVVSTAGC